MLPDNIDHADRMTKEKLEHFKQRLMEEKERLTQELQDLGMEDPHQKGHFEATYPETGGNSEDDNAQEVAEYADDLSIENRIEAELKDVDKALEAIDKGTYGTCKYCGRPIDEKRLEARPASSSCIDCKKILTQEM
jgi:RNA polymerase-binding protein DksA